MRLLTCSHRKTVPHGRSHKAPNAGPGLDESVCVQHLRTGGCGQLFLLPRRWLLFSQSAASVSLVTVHSLPRGTRWPGAAGGTCRLGPEAVCCPAVMCVAGTVSASASAELPGGRHRALSAAAFALPVPEAALESRVCSAPARRAG